MIGPSSSHTCGPSRIGYLSQQLLRGKVKKAHIEFARDGAYALMYKGQRSDMGFINGLMGNRPENPELRNAFHLAQKNGLEVAFSISDFPAIVPNIARLTLENEDGETVIVHSDSTGGGTIKLLKIDGFDVDIVGDCYELIIRTDCDQKKNKTLKNRIAAMFDNLEGSSFATLNGKGLLNIKRRTATEQTTLKEIASLPHVTDLLELKPILVVSSNRNAHLPFGSAEELLVQAENSGKALWELAVDYEVARSGWTTAQVMDYMQYVVRTMEDGVRKALTGDIKMNGILQPTAGKIDAYMRSSPNALNMGVLNTAMSWAIATMEYSNAMGVVLCAPTGGSAGVFPGAVLGVSNSMGLSMEDKIKAMLVTSIVGIVMSKDCNYSAELYGCQVEPGAASAMAAAGLVFLMRGTASESLAAASCALQNILGTICDPVAGLVQIPCINRNAMSVANAIVSANMIMGGFDPLIPLDQAAETLFRVGRQLPPELRCTCKGGLCITPCGEHLAREQEKRDNAR